MSDSTPSTPAPVQTGFADLGDIQVFSSTETPETLKETLTEDKEKPDLSTAASTLGKKGGEAAARARSERQEAQEAAGAQAEAGSDETPTPEGETPAQTKKDRARQRVEQATRAAAQAREEARLAREEAERYRQELEARSRPQDGPPEVDPFAEPKEEDYEQYSDWVREHNKWAATMATMYTRYEMAQEMEARQREQALEARKAEIYGGYSEAIQSADEAILRAIPAEFVQGLIPTSELPPNYPVGPQNKMADEILRSERPAEVMHYIVTHPEVRERLENASSPRAIVREMAMIEARLGTVTPAVPAQRAVSRAPAPLKQVSGVPHAADSPPSDDAPYEEHERYWNKRDAEMRRKRA